MDAPPEINSGGTRPASGQLRIISALGIAQIISWGTLFYAFGFLIQPLMQTTGAEQGTVVGAFSLGLLAAGLMSAPIGARIDRVGGRGLMTLGSLAAALLLAALSRVHSAPQLYVVWTGLGLAMAATLYDPAFAVLTRMFAANFRRAITALTLFGGLASTVFWPLTQWLIAVLGWRDTLLVLAALNLVVCAPIHWWVLPRRWTAARQRAAAGQGVGAFRAALRTPVFYLLAIAFTGNSLVFSAMQVHLMSMLQAKQLSAASAAAIGAMIGPMQVAGRVLELTVGARLKAATIGIIAMALLPASLLLLTAGNLAWPLLIAFAVSYGIGNGVMTIVRGAIAAELFGRDAYGAINGAMATPVVVAKAAGPLVAAILFTTLGGYDATLMVLIAVGALSTVLFALSTRANRDAVID